MGDNWLAAFINMRGGFSSRRRTTTPPRSSTCSALSAASSKLLAPPKSNKQEHAAGKISTALPFSLCVGVRAFQGREGGKRRNPLPGSIVRDGDVDVGHPEGVAELRGVDARGRDEKGDIVAVNPTRVLDLTRVGVGWVR